MAARLPAILPVLTVAALYAPSLVSMAGGFWHKEAGSYSPIVLAAAIALAWSRWPRAADAARSAVLAGTGLFALILAGCVLGRLLGNITLEFGSILFTVAGLAAALAGWAGLGRLLLPLATLAIAVPLPGSLVVALTFPLKMAVSAVVERLLGLFGLPVAREGVMLDIGDYRLLVADACSGLQSMVSLSAAALIYLALVGRRSATAATVLLLAVLPIAFGANVVRVTALALITYAFGDAAGQGFLHGFAGMLMFVCAFGGLMLVDGALMLGRTGAGGR